MIIANVIKEVISLSFFWSLSWCFSFAESDFILLKPPTKLTLIVIRLLSRAIYIWIAHMSETDDENGNCNQENWAW